MKKNKIDWKDVLIAAELSKISYPQHYKRGLKKLVFSRHTDTEIFHYCTNHKLYIVARGTESDDVKDYITDFSAWHSDCQIPKTEGQVHHGFQRAALSVIAPVAEYVSKALATIDVPVVFCGHSLGGAISLYVSLYLAHSGTLTRYPTLYTFGQPKVFNRHFWASVRLPNYYRFKNWLDPVTWVPVFMRHSGRKIRLSGKWGHDIDNYIHNIRRKL